MSDGRETARWRDEEMRAYLLGTLSPGRRTSLEELIFDDEEAYDALLDARYDLLDDYARGTLPASEREQVARQLLSGTADEGIAGLLSRRQPPVPRVEQARMEPARSRRRDQRLLIAAAVAVLAVGAAVWFALDNSRLRRDLSRAVDSRPPVGASAPGDVVARIELTPQTTRSQTAQEVTSPPTALVVDIVVPVEEIAAEYRVALEGRNGALRTEWRLTRAPDGALHLRLAAELLSAGVYELLVYAGAAADSPLVTAIPFRVAGGGLI
jgi:hypothetical protein